jgi:hypothetical protein
LNGTNHGGDAVTVAAKNDLATAYNDAVSRTPTTTEGAIFDLGGLTLTSGVYNDPSSFGLTGNLTLDAQGDLNAVWIFQAGSTLTTAANSMVTLLGGAQASNVFWQVGSSATLGADTAFEGNMLVFTSVTLATGASVDGSVLAENGAVALTTSTISIAVASIPEPNSALILGCGLAILFMYRRMILFPSLIPCRVKARRCVKEPVFLMPFDRYGLKRTLRASPFNPRFFASHFEWTQVDWSCPNFSSG